MTVTDLSNVADLERRLIVARALAMEHGVPLGFHDEEDQLDFDRKACAVLREIDALEPDKRPCSSCGGRGWHTAGGNDPAACNCLAGEAWGSDSSDEDRA